MKRCRCVKALRVGLLAQRRGVRRERGRKQFFSAPSAPLREKAGLLCLVGLPMGSVYGPHILFCQNPNEFGQIQFFVMRPLLLAKSADRFSKIIQPFAEGRRDRQHGRLANLALESLQISLGRRLIHFVGDDQSRPFQQRLVI